MCSDPGLGLHPSRHQGGDQWPDVPSRQPSNPSAATSAGAGGFAEGEEDEDKPLGRGNKALANCLHLH